MATKDGKKTGGRAKGTPNRLTADIKSMIETALHKAGGVNYLVAMAKENPAAFLALLGKIIPRDIRADVGGRVTLEDLLCGPRVPNVAASIRPASHH